jgi:hypothetical protein
VQVGVIAVDGTKISADASMRANRTYEQIAREILEEAAAADAADDARLGEQRGDELPAELVDRTTRRARLRTAKERLEVEVREAQDAHAARLQARADLEAQRGRKLRGRKPIARRQQSSIRARERTSPTRTAGWCVARVGSCRATTLRPSAPKRR